MEIVTHDPSDFKDAEIYCYAAYKYKRKGNWCKKNRNKLFIVKAKINLPSYSYSTGKPTMAVQNPNALAKCAENTDYSLRG